MKAILGIDCGVTGGLALLGPTWVVVEPMPRDENGVDFKALAAWLHFHKEEISIAAVEEAFAMPGQGFFAAFKFGINFGGVLGALAGAGIVYSRIPARLWSAEFPHGVAKVEGRTKQEQKALIKNARKLIAAELFPEVDLRESVRSKVSHEGMTDALLLAEFTRRKLRRTA